MCLNELSEADLSNCRKSTMSKEIGNIAVQYILKVLQIVLLLGLLLFPLPELGGPRPLKPQW